MAQGWTLLRAERKPEENAPEWVYGNRRPMVQLLNDVKAGTAVVTKVRHQTGTFRPFLYAE
jgi:hypothetical protein